MLIVTHQGCGRGVLSGLVLRRLYPGLQVSRRMEVFALVSAAAAFDVVHADDDRVLAAVHHAGLHRVSVAAVPLASRAVPPLEFSTDLVKGTTGALRRQFLYYSRSSNRNLVLKLHFKTKVLLLLRAQEECFFHADS